MATKTNPGQEYYRQLHALMQSKLRAANTFKKEMERIQEKLDDLGRFLTNSTPKGLQVLFEEAGVITGLLELGEVYLKIELPDPDCELGEPEKVFALFDELKKVWKGVVKIQLCQNLRQVKSGERLEVQLSSYKV